MPKKDWRHFIPFYVFFKSAPTVTDLAFNDLKRAQAVLEDAQLSLVEAQAEVTKRDTIFQYVTTVRVPA